ncbi:MAG: hypothetical protein IPK59_14500 [Rhodospirillaceae bacterium]|nr:hypothetical protein [Rhodospirillaceae bacterium]
MSRYLPDQFRIVVIGVLRAGLPKPYPPHLLAFPGRCIGPVDPAIVEALIEQGQAADLRLVAGKCSLDLGFQLLLRLSIHRIAEMRLVRIDAGLRIVADEGGTFFGKAHVIGRSFMVRCAERMLERNLVDVDQILDLGRRRNRAAFARSFSDVSVCNSLRLLRRCGHDRRPVVELAADLELVVLWLPAGRSKRRLIGLRRRMRLCPADRVDPLVMEMLGEFPLFCGDLAPGFNLGRVGEMAVEGLIHGWTHGFTPPKGVRKLPNVYCVRKRNVRYLFLLRSRDENPCKTKLCQ